MKVCLLVSGLQGMLNAALELASRLEKNKISVIVASSKDCAKKVHQEGFEFKFLPDISLVAKSTKHTNKNKLGNWLNRHINKKNNQREIISSINHENNFEWIKNKKIDLVVADCEMHEYILSLHAMNTKILLLSQWFSMWDQDGLPVISSQIIPGRGFYGSRLGMQLSWWAFKSKRRFMFLKQHLVSAGTDRRSLLIRAAKDSGFPEDFSNSYLWPGPVTYKMLPVISMTAREMEFPHQLRPNLVYVGPMVKLDRQEENAKDHVGRDINEIRQLAKEKKLKVIVSTSTTMKKEESPFNQRLLNAFKRKSDWFLILGPVKRDEISLPEGTSDQIALFSFLPLLSALSFADAVIHHGGIHTIHESIKLQVPALVLSGNKHDQNGCAARLAYHKLAIRKQRDKISEKDLVESLEKLLNSSCIKTSINDMSEIFNQYQEDMILENTVRQLIEGKHDKLSLIP